MGGARRTALTRSMSRRQAEAVRVPNLCCSHNPCCVFEHIMERHHHCLCRGMSRFARLCCRSGDASGSRTMWRIRTCAVHRSPGRPSSGRRACSAAGRGRAGAARELRGGAPPGRAGQHRAQHRQLARRHARAPGARALLRPVLVPQPGSRQWVRFCEVQSTAEHDQLPCPMLFPVACCWELPWRSYQCGATYQ